MTGSLKTLVCSSCKESCSIEVWSRINVQENPELKPMVKDGSAFVWECPHCGAANLRCVHSLYHDPEERLIIWFMPAGILPPEQEKALGEQIASSEELQDYTLRRVDDVGSLIEKVNIFDAGFDDCAMELCKRVTKMEMVEHGSSEEIMAAAFKFYKVDGPDNDLEFSYPSEGKMQGLRIGFNVYEDCAGILRRNPSMMPETGFSRVDQDWVAKYFG